MHSEVGLSGGVGRQDVVRHELPPEVVGGQNSWELGGVKMGFLRII